MSLERHRQDWERLAETDPFWAVLTSPGRKGGRWDMDEFFATGEAEVAHVLSVADGIGSPPARGRALDFGCGVGRLTRALGARFERVEGVDVSARMVDRARRLNADCPACEFHVNVAPDLGLFERDSFDLVYSSIVLQHLPSATVIEGYLGELVRVAVPGGLVVFGLPWRIPFPWSLQPRRRAYAVLRRARVSESWMLSRTPLTPMRMTAVAEERVRSVLARHGAAVVHTERIDEGPVRALRYYASVR